MAASPRQAAPPRPPALATAERPGGAVAQSQRIWHETVGGSHEPFPHGAAVALRHRSARGRRAAAASVRNRWPWATAATGSNQPISVDCLTRPMTTASRHSQRTAVGRRAHEIVTSTGADIRGMRMDVGLSQRRLADAAGIDHAFLSQIERGLREPSLAVLVAISTALGGELRVRIYPGTGPRIRDPLQARMVEALLRDLHPRWTRYLEVPVYRPVRGVIDLVLHDPMALVAGATEIQSELRRLEQQLRWSHEKADALPSASIWPSLEPCPCVDRLLIVRNTRVNRAVVERFAATLTTDYPAPAIDAYRALTTADAPWPGSAIVWIAVDGDAARILDRPPRGVSVGR